MTNWTELHQHAMENSEAFQTAIDNLDAGLSITGHAVRDPKSFEWTKTQINVLRRFAYQQKLTWEWAGFSAIKIRDRLTGDEVSVLQHSDLANGLSSLFCERMIVVALNMPDHMRETVEEEPGDDWADLDTSWVDTSDYQPDGQFAVHAAH